MWKQESSQNSKEALVNAPHFGLELGLFEKLALFFYMKESLHVNGCFIGPRVRM